MCYNDLRYVTGGLVLHRTRWIRKLDTLGRVVIPMDLRKELGIVKQDVFLISLNRTRHHPTRT